MTQQRLAAAAMILAACSTHADEMVLSPVPWDARGRFEQELQLPDDGIVEVCETLAVAAQVAWHFEAGAPLDFNVHYHAGNQVGTPVRKDQVRGASGVFRAQSAQEYCWMWKNTTGSAVQLRLQLLRH